MTDKKNIQLADNPSDKAATWFLKLRNDDMTEADYLGWQNWLAKDDTNAQAFVRTEKCWDDLDRVSGLPPIRSNNSGSLGLLRRFVPLAASLLIILSIGLFILNETATPVTATTYQTARAEHKSITLDDGSQITLGGQSIVNVNYSPRSRHITLVRGEVVFDVAKNKTRPFIVQVGKGTVTAIGTKFNIHASRQDVTVTVLEGIVEVNPLQIKDNRGDSPLSRVSAGKTVSYHDDGHISDVTNTNVDAVTSWEKGLLVRVNTPLADVIADVNRYSAREIIIGDPALNHINFTGTVLNDGIDNWLRGLATAYPIKVLDSGHNAILLLKKENIAIR